MKRNGYTLLEILIVMTLIVLMLGLTTVYFAGYLPSAKLNATGREMAALIRQARSLARLTGETRIIMIDLDERTFGLDNGSAQTIPPHVLVTILDPVYGEIKTGKYRYVFRPGGMDGGAILLTGGKKNLRLDLDPITGAVQTRTTEQYVMNR